MPDAVIDEGAVVIRMTEASKPRQDAVDKHGRRPDLIVLARQQQHRSVNFLDWDCDRCRVPETRHIFDEQRRLPYGRLTKTIPKISKNEIRIERVCDIGQRLSICGPGRVSRQMACAHATPKNKARRTRHHGAHARNGCRRVESRLGSARCAVDRNGTGIDVGSVAHPPNCLGEIFHRHVFKRRRQPHLAEIGQRQRRKSVRRKQHGDIRLPISAFGAAKNENTGMSRAVARFIERAQNSIPYRDAAYAGARETPLQRHTRNNSIPVPNFENGRNRSCKIRNFEEGVIRILRRGVRAHGPEQAHRICAAIRSRQRRLRIEVDCAARIRPKHCLASPPETITCQRPCDQCDGRVRA